VDDNPHQKALERQKQWVGDQQGEWKAHWTAYDDDYWGAAKARPVVSVQGTAVEGAFGEVNEGNYDLYGTQTNRVRPDVTSKMASLYYNGIQPEVTSDELPGKGDTKDAVARRVKAVEALLRRWIVDADLDDEQGRLLTMSMMYKGGLAMRLEVVPPDDRLTDQRAIDLIRPCPMPPWESVWDRKVRTKRLPYIGHWRQERIDKVKALGPLPDGFDVEAHSGGLLDVVLNGFTAIRDGAEEDENYLWVLTIDDFCDSTVFEAKGKSKERPGQRKHYVADTNGKLFGLNSGPIPYDDHAGYPVSDIVQLIVEPVPHRPHDSIAPVASVYEPNSELNIAQSILAGQFRRDAARVILTTDSDAVTLDRISRARDLELVTVKKGEGLLSQRYHVLDTGQSSENMAKYVEDVKGGLEDVRTTSDFTRGKAGQYMRAETSASLVEYDRKTIGRMRKASDKMLSLLLQRFLRILAVVMREMKEKSIRVIIDVPTDDGAPKQETYDLTPDHLERRYKIQIIDSAATPGLNAEKLATFQGSLGAMNELIMAAAPPNPETGEPSPEMATFSKMAFDHMAQLQDLPSQFNFANIQVSAPAPQPPSPQLPPGNATEEPAPPLPQEGQMPVEGMPMEGEIPPEALAATPLAGAIMDAAEGGL
jgi:hypothetical protein